MKKIYSGVIVKYKNKCLLCKRNNEGSLPGVWSIPGGKNEEGEQTKEAAKREFFEETALDIDNRNLDFVGLIPRHTRDGKNLKGLMYVYKLETEERMLPDLENAIDGSEHTECKYFEIGEINHKKTGISLFKMLKNILK